MRICTTAGLLLCLTCGSALSREPRQFTLSEKVAASELIFVGSAVKLERPTEVDGVDAFVFLRVVEAIKGVRIGEEIKFVVRGAIAEANPDCCDVGNQYLIFAVKGVQVFVLGDNEIDGSLARREEFASATNGKFSAYRVLPAIVQGWPIEGSAGNAPLPAVRSAIDAAISGGAVLRGD